MATVDARLASLRKFLESHASGETVFIVEGGGEYHTNHLILIPLPRKSKIASNEKGSMSQPTKARGHRATTNHHRAAGIGIILTSRQENKEEIYNDRQENGEREAGGHAPHLGNER